MSSFTGERNVSLVRGTGEQDVMPDAVEAGGQDMEQEAADELVGRKRHHSGDPHRNGDNPCSGR